MKKHLLSIAALSLATPALAYYDYEPPRITVTDIIPGWTYRHAREHNDGTRACRSTRPRLPA